MSILFAVVLGLIGLAALFVVPWVGAAFLGAAVVSALVGVFVIGAKASEGVDEEEPDAPHLPGPR